MKRILRFLCLTLLLLGGAAGFGGAAEAAETFSLPPVTYVNPLYADVIDASDLLPSQPSAELFGGEPTYLSYDEAVIFMREKMIQRVENITSPPLRVKPPLWRSSCSTVIL